jgi:purine-binding chemotaxis protein CheW
MANFTDDLLEQDSLKDKYLTFWTDGQIYGMSIAVVVQIIQMVEITPVPDFPSYARGVINLRGNIIPVIDMRLRLGKNEVTYDERTSIIVTNIDESNVGFIVDDVDEVTDIAAENIVEPPRFASENASSLLTGIGKDGKRIILLLDTARIISSEELQMIMQKGKI